MRQLHPEAIAAIQSKALFSQPEEALLAKIGSVSATVTFNTFRCCSKINEHQKYLFNLKFIDQMLLFF